MPKQVDTANLTVEEAAEVATAMQCLMFGYCCALCTVGLSCLPYFCCYHKRMTELSLKAAASSGVQPGAMGSGGDQQTGYGTGDHSS